MKNRINTCTVLYESWQMQCCGDELTVGKVADLFCIKRKRYNCYVGVDIDYDEEHHGQGANCKLRGVVTRIQAIFVDKYAKIANNTRYINDPNNEFAIVDTNFIDGYEECENYGSRKAWDVVDYIITLENVIEREYKDYPGDSSHGKYLNIEPGDEGKELFWDEGSNLIGDTDTISFYEGERKQTIDLTLFFWHDELVTWRNEFLEHIITGNSSWKNEDWLDWWCRGYCWAKRLREILPPDVQLCYGEKGQTHQVVTGNGSYFELNSKGQRVTICADVKLKSTEGLYIPSCCVDRGYDDDENFNYKFDVNRDDHHLFPDDRVMLCVDGRPAYQLGTVLLINKNSIFIHTDRWLDISEAYSIELID